MNSLRVSKNVNSFSSHVMHATESLLAQNKWVCRQKRDRRKRECLTPNSKCFECIYTLLESREISKLMCNDKGDVFYLFVLKGIRNEEKIEVQRNPFYLLLLF